MKKYFATYFRNFDYLLFFTYVFLCLFGLVMIYSAGMMVGIMYEDGTPDYFYRKQVINLVVAAVIFCIGAFFPYKHYSNKFVMLFGMAMMAILLVWLNVDGFGREETGSQSWIRVLGMSFQPSEYAKLFIILYIAGSFYKKSLKEKSIQYVKPNDIGYPIAIWLIILLSVGLETDLGAFIIIFMIAISVVFLSGIRGKSLFRFFTVLSAFGGVLAGALALFKHDSIFNASRLGRLQVWSNPFAYEQGSGYQVINGYLAIGQGGLEGVGLGQSIQKLGYLPEPQNDFIMAIIAEELGVLGVAIVIGGIGIIVLRSFYMAMTTKDPLARMIAGGIGSWIGFQTFVNLGGVSGVIPLTGVTLPFISYGGTSILMLSLAMGILMNVSMYYKKDKKKLL
ncbi:FtsW/RodA/SpoVE family cell cycle protein [Lysinibacillus sp. KU-BSD001]|uniref:FtsW/RodA/SpoVE family cell cycle protein n=1 Tax=Lysinibacillus sp. KU-BSD001 TaxID=3141328 RepID=UPI0036F09862